MLGFLIFKNIYFNLNEVCRNKILGNIFGIDNVSATNILVDDKGIILRLFNRNYFYQYVFIVENGINELNCSSSIIDCRGIYIYQKECNINNFIYRLFHCQAEYQVYLLMKTVL